MRQFLLLAFVLLAGCSPVKPQLPGPVWAEEFDQPLNRRVWSTDMVFPGTHGTKYHNEYYASYTLDENVQVRDGTLQLACEREVVLSETPPHQFQYSQGLISSHPGMSFLYGYLEVRARFPKGAGCWPCIWLLACSGHWPPEIDIAEYHGILNRMHFGMCSGEALTPLWYSSHKTQPNYTLWHTYGLDWRPGKLTWWFDGHPVKRVESPDVSAEPMYLILSNSVGAHGSSAGEPDVFTGFPNTLEIDYVRLYR